MAMQLDTAKLLNELDDLLGEAPLGSIGVLTAPPPAKPPPPPPPAEPPPAPATVPEPAVAARPPVPPRVLVADDQKDYRDVVQYILEASGYEVSVAEDGAAAIALATRQRFDLVVLDFNMPQKNGYEVIQALRSNDDTRHTPIIMFTGAPNRRYLKGMGLDISDFLEKPVSNEKLLESVVRIIGRPEAPAAKPAPLEPAALAPAPARKPAAVREFAVGRHEPVPPPSAPAAPQASGPKGRAADIPDLAALEEEDLNEADALLLDIEKESKEKGPDEDYSLEVMAKESPLISRVNHILLRAVDMGASDIHIEPQEKQLSVRVRVNGALQNLSALPSSLTSRLVARVKIMSDLSITERRIPQDGQFRATIHDKKVEFRVSSLPSTYGEKIVMRILGSSKVHASVGELGLSERDRQCAERALANPHGLILATGPTGSGKTTTLYSMLAQVNKPDTNILTAEDPVEYRLPGITQVHVKPAIGLTFESVLRAFLRQDPDIMLVGEIRDLVTAEIAVKASITGHLVLSTLHTNSAPATVTRLAHMGIAPFLIAASVRLVIAQRLIRVLCTSCKLRVGTSLDEKRLLTDAESARLKDVFRGVGCKECNQTGYSGRKPIFEVMPIRTREMRQAILGSCNMDTLSELAAKEGMVPLREAALCAVERGETSLAEALKVILSE